MLDNQQQGNAKHQKQAKSPKLPIMRTNLFQIFPIKPAGQPQKNNGKNHRKIHMPNSNAHGHKYTPLKLQFLFKKRTKRNLKWFFLGGGYSGYRR